MAVKYRIVMSSELARCRKTRLDVPHWVPRHRGEDCGTPLVVVVCGNLDWADRVPIEKRLRKLAAGSVVIHGDARGADRMAGAIARELGLEERQFPAEWKRYGRGAGPVRNKAMLEQKPDFVLACFGPQGPDLGTRNMMRQTERREIVVETLDA